MKKIIPLVCAISVIALGLAEIVFTFAGIAFPRPLNYVFWVLCIANAAMLMMNAKKKG